MAADHDVNHPLIPSHLRAFASPTEAPSTDVSKSVFAPPAPVPASQPEHGVRWRGPWQEDVDSTAIATRLHARALADQIPTRILADRGVFGSGTNQSVAIDGFLTRFTLEEVGHLRTTPFKNIVVIIDHMIPSFERILATVYPGQSLHHDPAMAEATARSRILFTVWERSGISKQMADIMGKFAQNWVPCARNAEMLTRHGVPNVHVVPHPFDPNSPLLDVGRAKKRPERTVLFYTIAKWEPRKALHEALGAFLCEFRPGDPVQYALKTTEGARWTNYPRNASESVLRWLDTVQVKERGWTRSNVDSAIRVITDKVPVDDIWRLHRVGHVYVSASHGEGFDLPAFDACLSRSRLIHTGWGGSEDYAPPGSIRTWSEDLGSEATHGDYQWHKAEWARVDIGRIMAAMRTAFEEREIGGGLVDPEAYSFSSVGRLMKWLISKVVVSNGREVRW